MAVHPISIWIELYTQERTTLQQQDLRSKCLICSYLFEQVILVNCYLSCFFFTVFLFHKVKNLLKFSSETVFIGIIELFFRNTSNLILAIITLYRFNKNLTMHSYIYWNWNWPWLYQLFINYFTHHLLLESIYLLLNLFNLILYNK